MVLVELCAGTASVSLAALAGRAVDPPVGYMGSKRRWARQLAEILGFGAERPSRVVLVDAGPWGDVWSVLAREEGREEVAALLDSWATGDEGAVGLWRRLVGLPPLAGDGPRIAQFLWLQARSAGCIPIWFDPNWTGKEEGRLGHWVSPSGSRGPGRRPDGQRVPCALGPAAEMGTEEGSRGLGAPHGKAAYRTDRPNTLVDASRRAKGTAPGWGVREASRCVRTDDGPLLERAHQRQAAHEVDQIAQETRREGAWVGASRGIMSPRTVARRIRALSPLPWDRVEVLRCDVREVDPEPGSVVYLDPPYLHCPRYAATLPRDQVLALARAHVEAGARVLVSEAEALSDLEGWTARRLPHSRPEWLTASYPIRVAEQLPLLGA